MAKVIFRREAADDLRTIIEWYEQTAPDAIATVVSDIYRTIDLLVDFPLLGAAVTGLPLRRIVSRKHHFKIAYSVTEQTVVIIGVYRWQDRDH